MRAQEEHGTAGGEDLLLVGRLVGRDATALAALYDRYSGPVYSLAFRIVRDPSTAEEITQDVFLKLWRQPDRFDPARGAFASWLLRTAHNRAIDEIRAQRAANLVADVELALLEVRDEAPLPEERASLREERTLVRAALGQLPENQRTVLELAYFGGFTQRQIAERTHEPLGTIKTRARLALMKLRSILETAAPAPWSANGATSRTSLRAEGSDVSV